MGEDAGLEILWHAIGMKRGNYRRSMAWWLDNGNHRNNYCVSVVPRSFDVDRLEELAGLGLMKAGPHINEGRDRYYFVTPDGIKHAKASYARLVKQKGAAHE